MKKLIILLLIIPILFSCDKYPFPGTVVLERMDFQVVGNDQYEMAGNYFPDSVGVIIDMEFAIVEGEKNFYVEFEVTEGGGTIDQPIVYSNQNGRMFTRWKSGENANDQVIIAKIYNSQNKFLTETQISGTSYFSGDWNLISSGIFTRITDLVKDTVNQRSAIASNGSLYFSGQEFYQWEEISTSFSGGIKNIEIDSKGTLYANGSMGKLYKSPDWGETWIQCTNPIPGNSVAFQFSISSDDFLWASRSNYGMWCSTDGGLNWHRDTLGLENSNFMGRVYSLNDGSHICVSQSQLQIFRTLNNGFSWEPVNSPENARSCFITENNEIIVLAETDGYSIFKSTDMGATYEKVKKATPLHYIFPFGENFSRFGNQYYVYLPGADLYKTSDFETFELLLVANDKRSFYVDHRGTFYVCGNNGEAVYIYSE